MSNTYYGHATNNYFSPQRRASELRYNNGLEDEKEKEIEPFYSLDQNTTNRKINGFNGRDQVDLSSFYLQQNLRQQPDQQTLFVYNQPTGNNYNFDHHRQITNFGGHVSALCFPKSSLETQAQVRRQQHTLGSIGTEKSGSRSPLVDGGGDFGLISHNPSYNRMSSRQEKTRNPFSLSNGSSDSLQVQKPLELISNLSFERRRSVFEADLANNEARLTGDNQLGLNQPRMLIGEQNFRHQNKATEGTDESDNLSLDQIFADLQSGKIPCVVQSPSMEITVPPVAVSRVDSPRRVDDSPFNTTTTQSDSSNILPNDGERRTIFSRGNQNSQRSARTRGHRSNASSMRSCKNRDNSDKYETDSNRELQPSKVAMNSERRKHESERGFEVAWLDFTYSIEPNIFEDPRWGRINSLFHKERRMILKGLSGGFKSGQMVALMGPSGAGKTCLLECISGVRLTGIGGQLCLRGRKHAQLVIVPQYDDFLPQFTVEEIVIYGSKMKNPPKSDHRKIANEVIEQLGLQVCRNNNIQACSGGQRKRVAIAQELVSRPNILILDEPTSGLDSSCCYHTMKVLRDVLDQSVNTDQPMAIVSTIHQPSAKVFKMFDLVYLLGKTGLTAYSGPPGDLLPTIHDVTGLDCPQYSNPSDFMIELVAYDYGEEPVEKLIEFERLKARQYVRDYERRAGIVSASSGDSTAATTATTILSTSLINPSQQAVAATTGLQQGHRRRSSTRLDNMGNGSGAFGGRLVPSKSDTNLVIRDNQLLQRLKTPHPAIEHVEYKNNTSCSLRRATRCDSSKHPFFWHSWVHLHRSFLQAIRDPILNNMRILIHLGFASLLVLLYGKKSGDARGCPPILGLPTEITDPKNESMIDLADNIGYLFMCIMMITYVSLMSTVLTFPIDIKTVGKEYKNGWYGTFTYFLGKTIADLPFITLYPVCYCLITWYVTNQAHDQNWRFLSFTGLIIMNAMNSQSFGLILGALFVNSVTAATFLGPVITIPWYLFTGFTKRIHRLGEPHKTTSRFLFTRYIFEGLLDTVYGHERCNCSEFLQKYYELRYEEAVRLGQMISVETLSSLDYYDGLETVADVVNETLFPKSGSESQWLEKTVNAASTVFADGENLNLAGLIETNGKASSLFSFGLDFEPTCPTDYRNYIIQDFRLEDDSTKQAFIVTAGMLSIIRVLTFLVVTWKIRTRQL